MRVNHQHETNNLASNSGLFGCALSAQNCAPISPEKNSKLQNAQHKDWHCTEEMMELTRDGEALYMHCLPADISGVSCKEGEVTEGVFEKYRIATYKEASWKPYIIAAMILSRKYAKPGALLEQLLKEAQERVK
ncbi:hypothetical protein ACIUQI_003795 [Escherichia coli]